MPWLKSINGKEIIMKLNGFSGVVSLLILAAIVYMAFNYGRNGKLLGK
jgi:hypothetical protein